MQRARTAMYNQDKNASFEIFRHEINARKYTRWHLKEIAFSFKFKQNKNRLRHKISEFKNKTSCKIFTRSLISYID